ncbi:MAG: glucosaminidase domain-containing protein [Hespellia sp.]|nr:glucosaminidase domain-containing protein [Hespellia sp.]
MKNEKMENIKKQFTLGMLCLIMLTCVSRLQNEVCQNTGTLQKVKVQKQQEDVKSEDASDENAEASAGDITTEDSADTAASAAVEVNAENGYSIMGESSVTLGQMTSFFESSGKTYPSEALAQGGAPTIEDYCQMFLEESAAEGIRAEIPFVQSMKETGWLQFEGVCDISQYNFAGLGATGGDVAGESFTDVRTGIRAQIQHLKAYATTDPLVEGCVDGRYALVKKASAPYVQWLGQQENPEGYGWATDPGYGISLAEMIQNLKSF